MGTKSRNARIDDVTSDVLRYKVLLLGDTGSGKTSMTRALMGREFLVKMNTTVGMNYGGVDYDVKFKALLLGDTGVGKTSVARALVGKESCPNSLPTVGIDFVKRGFEVDGAKVLLEVWDTAGQERFRSISRFHYRGTKGIILMYDITDKKTFETLDYWIQSIEKDIDGKTTEPVPVFIVGNKTDLQDKRVISTAKGKQIAEANFVHGFIETSAKQSSNVQKVFEELAYAMVEINDPAKLGAYKHLRKKDGELPQLKDFTRTFQDSIRLKPNQCKKKRSCKCSKSQ